MIKQKMPLLSCFLLSLLLTGCFEKDQNRLFLHTQNTEYTNGILTAAFPRPNQHVHGDWENDLANPTGSVKTFDGRTGANGRFDVVNPRMNAVWVFSVDFAPTCNDSQRGPISHDVELVNFLSTGSHDFTWECRTDHFGFLATPAFSLTSAYPTSITVPSQTPLTTDSGMPLMYTYLRDGSVAWTATASSVAPDGSSAVFPYPRRSDGNPLDPDLYGYAVVNSRPDGLDFADGNWFSLGSRSTAYPHAFGVDAVALQSSYTECDTQDPYNDGTCAGMTTCNSSSSSSHFPAVTLYDAGQLSYPGGWNASVVGVQSHPTVVRVFNNQTTYDGGPIGWCSNWSSESTGPTSALVVNTGSNSVSYIDLPSGTVFAHIPVGQQPTDVVLSADESKAYVVNSGDGTVGEIDLSRRAQTRVVQVGSQPRSITRDTSGHVWIGGNGFIAEVDVASMIVAANDAVQGMVTSVARSEGQNKLITVFDPVTLQNGAMTMAYASNGTATNSFQGSSPAVATSQYSASSISASLLSPAQLGTGALVSPNVNNAFAVTANGSSFTVVDVSTGNTILTGTADAPIRSFALEQGAGLIYFTVPDSNSVISVPIPPLPQL